MGKIPPEAKRVFKGVIYDVYHWEQELYDGSTTTFEMLTRPDNASVIVTAGDKILVPTEEQPGLPPLESGDFGGRVDGGEEPLAAAKRELLEEAGMESDDWHKLETFDPHNKIDMQVHLFVARNAKKVAEPKLEAGEKITTRWVNFDEFLEITSKEAYWNWARETARYIHFGTHTPEKKEYFRRQLFEL